MDEFRTLGGKVSTIKRHLHVFQLVLTILGKEFHTSEGKMSNVKFQDYSKMGFIF